MPSDAITTPSGPTWMCRLEYLTPSGWKHRVDVRLLHPERYPERMAAQNKFGRAINLDTGEVFEPDNVPDDLSILEPTTGYAFRMPDPSRPCGVCEERHPPPYDGTCLI